MQRLSQGVPKWHANTRKPRDAASVTRSKFKVSQNDMLTLGNHAMQRRSQGAAK